MVLMRGLLPSAMRKITIKKYWYKFHSHKRLKRIPNLLAYFILCFIIIFFSNSNLIIYYISSIKEDNNFNQDFNPKASDPPVISILSPDNYTLFGTNAPNYSLTITDGIGNYSWYEFLETGEKSVPKELEGILNEDMTINRGRLGKIVFDSEEKLKKLNQITHPESKVLVIDLQTNRLTSTTSLSIV